MGGAVGGVIAGLFAPRMSRRLGPGTCLAISLGGMGLSSGAIGLCSWWPLVFVLTGAGALFGTLWNVITVSLRQSIIPPELLGRVNSVYRFFAWGMMPIGSAVGGLLVVALDRSFARSIALRVPWFVQGGIYAFLFVAGLRKLTTARISAARTGVLVAG
jgi:MFS family permease